MKKWIGLLLAVALSACMVFSALADCTLTELGTLEDAAWIDNSSLLRVPAEEGYRVYSVENQPLTDEIYSFLAYEYSYVVASPVGGGFNSTGLFDTAGQLIMPYQYGAVNILNRNWALGFVLVEATADNYDFASRDNMYYLVDTIDVYNLGKGTRVGTFPRANLTDAKAVDDVINIADPSSGVITCYDADFNVLGTVKSIEDCTYAPAELTEFRENDQYGLKDAAGNIVLAASFHSIEGFLDGEYSAFSTDEKTGLINKQGNIVIPAEYSEIKRGDYGPYNPEAPFGVYNAGGYFAVVKGGNLGFVDAQGRITCEPTHSKKDLKLYGASASYADADGVMHILSADGVDFSTAGYENVRCLTGSSGQLFRVTDANRNDGVIDWHGNVVLECAYKSISLSGDGRYLLATDYKSPYTLYQVNYETAQAAKSSP